jgi:hypothetical protein
VLRSWNESEQGESACGNVFFVFQAARNRKLSRDLETEDSVERSYSRAMRILESGFSHDGVCRIEYVQGGDVSELANEIKHK